MNVSAFAAEQLCDLHGGAEFAERVIGQDLDILDILNALVHVFVQQRTQNFLCQAGILVEVSTLADIVRPLCLRQRCLIVGNVADEVEIVNILIPGDLPQRFQQDATLLQLVDYGLLLLLGIPGTKERIQGGILAEDVLLGVVRHAFRDELAVLVVVLDTLIQDRDLDTTHPEFVLLFRRIVGVPTGAGSRNGWLRWIGSRLFAGIIAIINDIETDKGYIWEYTFTMPIDEATLEFKVEGGI